jgi:alcohol dehydrogenase class IV
MSRTGYFKYNMRTAVHCAAGSIIRLPALFDGFGAKRVLLISDAGLKQVGIVDQIVSVFEGTASGAGANLVGVYADITPDAGTKTINDCLRYAREIAADAILAVGGGSVLDAAKGVKYALHKNLTDIRKAVPAGIKLDDWPSVQPIDIPHIAVPTTAGTGAEVSPVAVFFHEDLGIKINLVVPFIDADIAVLDANLTVGLPPGLTASTGMDALTHALEAVASPASNHFSDAHSVTAAQIIVENLPLAVANGKNVDARSNMLQASTMAIDGFAAALGAIPVHNCAHAFGGLYHIPHGDANAALLPVVMEVLPEFYLPNAERLAKALDLKAADSPEEALKAVIKRLKDLQQQIGCATSFSRWGAKAEDMEQIILAVTSDPAAMFFPIPPERIQMIAESMFG